MVTIKDIKEFRGLSTKERTATAIDIGRKFSEGTALGKVAMLALGAGLDAKAAGDKTFTFDATFNAFAGEYFANVSDGTLTTYRSAFGNWTKAGMHSAFDATELAVRVWNESKYALSNRGTMLKKLLKDKPPTPKEYNAAKPATENNPKPKTIGAAAERLLRSIDAFGVEWIKELDKAGKASLADIRGKVEAFAATYAENAEKPTAKGEKVKKPTFADQRKAMLAELIKAKPAGGSKTLN
jgi:hypothetical protein